MGGGYDKKKKEKLSLVEWKHSAILRLGNCEWMSCEVWPSKLLDWEPPGRRGRTEGRTEVNRRFIGGDSQIPEFADSVG